MPDDKQESRWAIPPHVTALSEEELETQLNIYLDKDNGRLSHQDVQVQRILATLVQERTNVARLRHWVAMAGSNTAKPTAEAKVSFIAMSAALDLIMGGPDDLAEAISLLNTAVTQVALSQAGKLDLDLVEWAARDLEIQKNKPMVKMLLGTHAQFHVLEGKPDASSGAAEVAPRQGAPVHTYDGAVEVCAECGLPPGQLKGSHCITCGRTNSGG